MSKIRVLSGPVLISTDYRGAYMSGIVVDGNNQIKQNHSKWLILSRWLRDAQKSTKLQFEQEISETAEHPLALQIMEEPGTSSKAM